MCGSCSRSAGAAGGVDFMRPPVTELCCCFYRVAQTPCDRQMEREVMTHTDTRFSTAVTKRDKGLKHEEQLRKPETLHFFLLLTISWFSKSPVSLFFLKADTKRRGAFSTLNFSFTLQLQLFSLGPLSSAVAVTLGNSTAYPTMSLKSNRIKKS